MLIARWQIDARFGHKPQVIQALKTWAREIAPKIGLEEGRGHILSGSIGALEATVEHNYQIESLAELERCWEKLATLESHKKWGEALEAHVVSGTARWEVFRVI